MLTPFLVAITGSPSKVSGALFELREVFDRLQRALRTEQSLNVYAAQRRRFDPAPIFLRPNVADEVRGAVRVAVDVTVETSDA